MNVTRVIPLMIAMKILRAPTKMAPLRVLVMQVLLGMERIVKVSFYINWK